MAACTRSGFSLALGLPFRTGVTFPPTCVWKRPFGRSLHPILLVFAVGFLLFRLLGGANAQVWLPLCRESLIPTGASTVLKPHPMPLPPADQFRLVRGLVLLPTVGVLFSRVPIAIFPGGSRHPTVVATFGKVCCSTWYVIP